MKSGDLFPIATDSHHFMVRVALRSGLPQHSLSSLPKTGNVRAMYTGQQRWPRKGEWFLSGGPMEAYYAHADLSETRPIATLVITELVSVRRVIGRLSGN